MHLSSNLKRSAIERSGFVVLAVLVASFVWSLHSSASKFGGALKSDASTADSSSLPQPVESPTPCCNDKPHLLVGTYYSVKDGLNAKLLLNNKGPDPLVASPTLFSMSGERFDAPPVTIDGQSFQMIDMSTWINAAGLPFQEGSIEVFHVGKDLVLGAQVYLVDEANSLSFDEKLVETKTFKSSRLEGLWWMPSQKGQVLLALSNNSDFAITATVNADGHTPERSGEENVTLAAHQTSLLDVQRDVIHHANGAMSKFGGISITYSGSPGAVYARAMAQDLSIGYSLAVQFSDPAAGKSSQLQGVGLRLGFAGGEALNPIAVVRNVGSSNTTVTGRVSYTDQAGATNVVPMADLHLSPSEMVNVDLGQLLQQHAHRQPDAIGGLELEYSTPKGSVVASAFSVSPSGNQVFRVPMWDIYALRSSTGGYPWSIDGNSSTMVYIKNSAAQQQHYFMNVRFDGGDYQIGRKTIEAGETVGFDLRKLRDEQAPDIHGRKIPLTANGGQIHWTKVGIEDGVLIGRSEQVDTMLGVSSNYACANCCNDSAGSPEISPSQGAAIIDDQFTFTARDSLQTCYGYSYPQDIYAANWVSSNDNIASVSVGQATGSAETGGTVTITADWYDDKWRVVSNSSGGEIAGTTDCEPVPTHFTATATFKVKVPTSLSLSIGSLRTHNGGPITNCQGQTLPNGQSVFGYSRLLTYTVLDQDGHTFAHSGYEAEEQFHAVSCNPSPDACEDGSSTTDVDQSQGTFCDVQSLTTLAPPAPQTGQYSKLKQIISITTSGHLWVVRVNCINKQSNDLTITDTTSTPDAACP